MSAFVISPKTFSEIYSGLKIWKESKVNYEISNGVEKALEGKEPEEFIDVLYRLNVRAVNHRYSENEAENHSRAQLVEKCVFNPHISRWQFLKSLECLRYQMSEGDVPETKPYKLVEQLINAVCVAIVHSSKEYEQAHWD